MVSLIKSDFAMLWGKSMQANKSLKMTKPWRVQIRCGDNLDQRGRRRESDREAHKKAAKSGGGGGSRSSNNSGSSGSDGSVMAVMYKERKSCTVQAMNTLLLIPTRTRLTDRKRTVDLFRRLTHDLELTRVWVYAVRPLENLLHPAAECFHLPDRNRESVSNVPPLSVEVRFGIRCISRIVCRCVILCACKYCMLFLKRVRVHCLCVQMKKNVLFKKGKKMRKESFRFCVKPEVHRIADVETKEEKKKKRAKGDVVIWRSQAYDWISIRYRFKNIDGSPMCWICIRCNDKYIQLVLTTGVFGFESILKTNGNQSGKIDVEN